MNGAHFPPSSPSSRAFADPIPIQTKYERRIEQIAVPNVIQLFTRDLENGWEYQSKVCFPAIKQCWMIGRKLVNLWNQKWRPMWYSKQGPCWKSQVSLIFEALEGDTTLYARSGEPVFPTVKFHYPHGPTVPDDRQKTFQLPNSSSWLSVGLHSTCGERKYKLSNQDVVLEYHGERAGKQSFEEGKDEKQ